MTHAELAGIIAIASTEHPLLGDPAIPAPNQASRINYHQSILRPVIDAVFQSYLVNNPNTRNPLRELETGLQQELSAAVDAAASYSRF